MKILYFGRLSDRFGACEELVLPDNISSISMLTNWLEEKNNAKGVLSNKSIRIMVNQGLTNSDIDLHGDEEIAFLPPVGGG